MSQDDSTSDTSGTGEPRGLRFLFYTLPVTGHVSPLLPVARLLVQRGHEVRWYTSSRFRERIERTGAASLPYRAARDVDYDRLNEIFPERAEIKGRISQLRFDLKRVFIDMGVEQVEDLLAILEEYPADVLVGDATSIAAMMAAEKTNLPLGLVNILNLFIPSVDTAPDGVGLGPSASRAGRLRNRLLNWLLFRVVLHDVNAHFRAAARKLDLAPRDEVLLEMPVSRSQLFLQPTIPTFEYPRSDLPDHVRFIGALLPEAPASFEEPEWWADLASNRPVVLVTQGTVATDLDDLLVPAIRGLADEDVLVVATTGDRLSDDLGLTTLPANVRAAPYVPFGQLMPHVDVMVTNGGYGGVHFALVNGIPMVAGGMTEDKTEVCARIGWSGVGINLRTKRAKPEQVRAAVRRVLAEPSYRNRATAMQAELAGYDGPRTAADLLEALRQG